MYSDPNGEYFIWDDIIGAFISGVVNTVTNLGNIHSFGQGFSYFCVGASGYLVSEYASPFAGGAYISGSNNVLTQGYTNGFGNINGSQVLFSSVMGGLTAEAGQFVSRSIAPGMSKIAGSLTESPVLQQQLIQGTTNAAAGFSINTGFSLLNGDNLKVALGKGSQGALFGLGLGVINGTSTGIQIANRYHENPWTGVPREISDDAFVHVTTPKGARNIKSYGLDPDISGYVTKWKYIKDVTDPSDFNTMLYKQDLWPQMDGKFNNGFNILKIDATPTFYSPRTNWVNGVPQWRFYDLVSKSNITIIK